ncbi:MAG: MFS transporter [Promethearchaeota archaeon]
MKTMSFLNKNFINILTLTVTHFIWGFVNFIYLIQIQPFLLSIYGTSHEAAQILGFILSLGSFSALIPLLMGFLADSYGRKNIVLFGQFLGIIGLIGLSISNTVVLLVLFSITVFNLGFGFYDPPLQAIVHESTPKEKRGSAYSIIYNSSSIAGIIASLIIQQEANGDFFSFFQMGYLLMGLATIINVIFLHDILPNKKQIDFLFIKIFREPISRITAIALAVDSFVWGLPYSIANGVYIILFDVDVTFIATLTFVEILFMVLLQYPAGLAIDRFGRIFGLITGEIAGILWIILVIIAILIPDNTTEMLLFANAFLGASSSFWAPAVTLAKFSIDTSSAASTNFATISFIEYLGWAPTAAIGGFLFSIMGFLPLLLVTFIGTLIVIAMFIKIDNIQKNNQPS